MQRFFLNTSSFTKDTVALTDPAVIHQMIHVLRIEPGDSFIALDNNGDEYRCTVTSLHQEKIEARIFEKRKNSSEPDFFVTLYQALPKKMDLFELVLQKGTEIGVGRFIPLITERTERTSLPKRARLEKILKEAAEQCERGKIPELGKPIVIANALASLAGQQAQRSLFLDGRGNYPLLSSKLPEIKNWNSCNLFIGPEGGFSEEEINCAQEKGCLVSSLGPRILRTETAGIAAAALLLLS